MPNEQSAIKQGLLITIATDERPLISHVLCIGIGVSSLITIRRKVASCSHNSIALTPPVSTRASSRVNCDMRQLSATDELHSTSRTTHNEQWAAKQNRIEMITQKKRKATDRRALAMRDVFERERATRTSCQVYSRVARPGVRVTSRNFKLVAPGSVRPVWPVTFNVTRTYIYTTGTIE